MAREAVTLTTKLLEGGKLLDRAKARGARLDFPDAGRSGVPGLMIRVTPTGVMSWAVLYRRETDGARRRVTIGGFPEYGLAEAREAARAIRAAVARGEDPAERPAPAIAAAPYTFDMLADAWLAHRRQRTRSRSGRAVDDEARVLARDVRPAIGAKEADAVTRADVARAIDALAKRLLDRGGKGVRANRALTILGAVYNWGLGRDLVTVNPATRVQKPVDEAPRDRVLTNGEIRDFWVGLDKCPMDDGMRLALKLALVTGQRIGQVSVWAKADLDLSGEPVWIAPGATTKNKRVHRVPLSPLAMELVQQAIERSGSSPFLFPGRGTNGPIHPEAASHAVLRSREVLPVEPFTAHDLRRTTASHMAEMGVADGIIERVLDHAKSSRSSVTAAVYVRYGFEREKRAALELWASKLGKIVSGEADARPAANVIPMRGV